MSSPAENEEVEAVAEVEAKAYAWMRVRKDPPSSSFDQPAVRRPESVVVSVRGAEGLQAHEIPPNKVLVFSTRGKSMLEWAQPRALNR